ncbi:MAG: hypothetical protein IBX70_11885 [Clostridia bacterium]|nr:hypothetical protein [Clostridia bacterium]
MAKFRKELKVIFMDGKKKVERDERFDKYTKMSSDGSINLDLESQIDVKVLDILLSADTLTLNDSEYTILNRNFMEIGNALYVEVSKNPS